MSSRPPGPPSVRAMPRNRASTGDRQLTSRADTHDGNVNVALECEGISLVFSYNPQTTEPELVLDFVESFPETVRKVLADLFSREPDRP